LLCWGEFQRGKINPGLCYFFVLFVLILNLHNS